MAGDRRRIEIGTAGCGLRKVAGPGSEFFLGGSQRILPVQKLKMIGLMMMIMIIIMMIDFMNH